jgi:uncharacterized protein HemX
MKRIWAAMIALILGVSMSAFAQTGTMTTKKDSDAAQDQAEKNKKESKKAEKAEKKEAEAAEKGKTMRLTGWVKMEGDRATFVNDKDKQTWTVSNSDMLKGHDGHHIKIKAKLDESNHSLTVVTMKMMRKGKQAKKS